MGSKKTPTKMIQGANARQVSFSKRRTGIFKKASELCTLCAVETAVVIFSPGGKAFTFGHPCFDAIMKRLANPGSLDSGFAQHMAEHEARICDLNKQYSYLLQQLAAEKKRGEELTKMRKAHGMPLLDKPMDDLNLNELETLKAMMEQLKGNLVKRLGELSVQTSDPSASSSANSSVTNPKGIDSYGVCFRD